MALFSLKQAANELSLSECSLRRIVARREIQYRKIGKKQLFFTPEDIDSYVKQCTVPAIVSGQNAS
jgi:hypothetical protein